MTDGDSLYGNCFITSIKPGGANIGSPATEKFTMTLHPEKFLYIAPTVDNWYDDVDTLVIVGGAFGITALTSPKQLQALVSVGSGFSFIPPSADLTWISGTPAKMTVETAPTLLTPGLVTFVAAGTSIITCKITAKTSVINTALGTAT
jgi:hypothetical protein